MVNAANGAGKAQRGLAAMLGAGGKLNTGEGGLRSPLVVRWPRHIRPHKGSLVVRQGDGAFGASTANPETERVRVG
jgi:hypothetical protein